MNARLKFMSHPGPASASSSNATHPNAELDRLMEAYAEGHDAAFTALHHHLAPRLRMFLLRLCGKPALADDLVQDAFFRMHRARGSFSKGSAVLPWAYAIARNACIDHARKARGKQTGSLDDLEERSQIPASDEASPDAQYAAKETLDLVKTTLDALPATHREAFILLRFEGLSVAEAAVILDTSEANVKVRAFRAYEAFRAALGTPAKAGGKTP